MGATNKVVIAVYDAHGRQTGVLTVELPGQVETAGNPAPLLDLRGEPGVDPGLEPIQLLEGGEYRYTFAPLPPITGPIRFDRPELFSPDDGHDWKAGRFRPGFYTGTLPIAVLAGERELGRVSFEVRSRKLDYVNEYRWMLEDIADSLAELVMERFAPTEQRFGVADGWSAQTLYQQFAFLKGLFSGEGFAAAVHQVISRPHRAWVDQTEWRRPGQAVPMGAGVARQLLRPGPRVAWAPAAGQPPVPTLPARLEVARTAETLDTPENRFVKFALLRWRDFTADVERALLAEKPNAPVRRGLREVQAVYEQLNELLSADLFAEVGRLGHFPAGSQVLQKRAGYRDLYRAYIQFEAAALLTWEGGEDVYGAGQRDVATLYEYWVFLQLVRVMERLCQREFDRSPLLERRPDGMGVALRRGQSRALQGSVTRLGRQIGIELWFNRTFSRLGNRESWSRPMRPDYSIRIKPEAAYGASDEVWLHFDAKYRVEALVDLFGADPDSEAAEAALLSEEQAAEAKLVPTRADLLKMHTYRDAIRRSAGAYVIYPGTEPECLPMFHELLPGLGAFPLRPTKDGEATGADALHAFLEDVITHVATQATQHERTRFWVRTATRGEYQARQRPAVPFLTRPPADTPVLLGYVRTPQHLAWIHRERRYNLRADPSRRGSVGLDAQELGVEFVLIYGAQRQEIELWRVQGAPELYTEERMRRSGYPSPQGAYFCLPLTPVDFRPWLEHLNTQAVMELTWTRGGARGRPVTVTWLDLVQWPDRVQS